MRIDNTKRTIAKIAQMQFAREILSYFESALTDKTNSYTCIPSDPEISRKDAAGMIALTKPGYSIDKLILILTIRDLMNSEFAEDPRSAAYFMKEISKSCKVFATEELMQDPYIRDIKFSEQRTGDFELHYMDLKPYELFVYDTPHLIIPDVYIAIPCMGCFTEKIQYPAISQISTDTTWMTVSPNEIYTMKKPIDNAFGKVLTLGCGMGYFTYMASLKEDVTSITVIEKEQDVIDLFSEYILPQFRHKEKVNIIKADAIEYMRSLEDGEFDYCFADIWQGTQDIVPYFAVKEIGRNFRKTKIDYWIEDSFAYLISNMIWLEIMETFAKINHFDLSELPDFNNARDARLHNYVHNLLKKAEIKSPDHINYYLEPKNIVSMINRTKVIF